MYHKYWSLLNPTKSCDWLRMAFNYISMYEYPINLKIISCQNL